MCIGKTANEKNSFKAQPKKNDSPIQSKPPERSSNSSTHSAQQKSATIPSNNKPNKNDSSLDKIGTSDKASRNSPLKVK